MAFDHLSYATTPIVALREDRPLWQGSGFFYLHQDGDRQTLYLVTNQHVLTGRPPGDGDGARATHVLFQFHASAENPGDVRPVKVPLATPQGQRVWLHSERHPGADVAVIPVPAHLCEGVQINCLNADWARVADRSALAMVAPVHVVGFPYGYHDRKNALPVWQTGALASEPAADFEGQPLMAINLPAYPGMSGAPAFAMVHRDPSGPGAAPGVARQFIGVYASLPITDDGSFPEAFCAAGRPGTAARDAAQWGHVWRAELLEELVSAVDTERWEREVLAELA